ncbi:MAG: efflux RND transporter periplasmic adaptor subunit [Vicinamibacteria bacterium]
MSSATLIGERMGRLFARGRESLSGAARWGWDAVRPWLRPGGWTPESREALIAAARRHPRRMALIAAGLLALLGTAYFRTGGAAAGLPTAVVTEGPFRVTVVETGTLQALRSITYSSQIQSNQAKIVALAPEGRLVQKGDLLVLFDSAPFEEEIRRSQALLSQAQADLQKANQDFKLQGIQNQEEVAIARQKVERSELELKDVQNGKGRLKEEEAGAAVTNAERELRKAESSADDLRPLLAEGFITKQELDRAEQQVGHAREELALAERRKDALLDFGRPLELSQARADAVLTREGYKQLESAALYRLEQKKAAIAGAESRIEEAGSKLSLAKQQLARTEVRADVPGIVVYKDVFFGSEQRKPQVGDQVWANQPLLILPDISKMVVETKVRETDIHKVEKNQRVSVHVEAYPELKLTGAVTLVGTLAQEEKERRGAKFFGVTILVNESEPRLRPGMTSRIEIQVEERRSAVSIPLDAVFERDGRTLTYVASGRRVEARDVVLGPANQDFVVVDRGLRKGERVCLRDPGAAPSDFGSLTTP